MKSLQFCAEDLSAASYSILSLRSLEFEFHRCEQCPAYFAGNAEFGELFRNVLQEKFSDIEIPAQPRQVGPIMRAHVAGVNSVIAERTIQNHRAAERQCARNNGQVSAEDELLWKGTNLFQNFSTDRKAARSQKRNSRVSHPGGINA